MRNLKKHKKEKQKKNSCEHTCPNCSCQNIRFLCIFHFCFLAISILSEMFLIGSQTQKKQKIWKQQKKNNNTRTRCKAKIDLRLWFKTKQDNKKKKTKTNEDLETKSKQTNNKKQGPET